MRPRGIDLDIVERTSFDGNPLNVVAPNYVAIDGFPVLVPSDSTIEIHASDQGVVTARLTLMVGKLRVHAEREPVDDEPTPIFDAINLALLVGCGWQLMP